MKTNPTVTASKVVSAGLGIALLSAALLPTAALAETLPQTAQNQAFRPQLALFEGFSSWFTQFKNSLSPATTPTPSVFVAPTPAAPTISEEDTLQNLYHGQNILNRLQGKYSELDKTATQLSKQVEDFTTRGFDTSKVKVFTDLAQDKLSVARYDIGTATSTMLMVPDDEQSTNEDIRTTLKAADESVRTAGQAVSMAKTKVRDFSLKIRKESKTISN